MKKLIYVVLILILLGIFGYSAWNVADILLDYRKGEEFYQEMDQFISIPETTMPPETTATVAEENQEEPDASQPTQPQIPWPQVDFTALKALNPDVVGWIYIPDTKVNYPIAQGADNDQYLHRLLTGEYNSGGTIFLDAGVSADFAWQNSPIYGHNMKNGSMFADITGYKSQAFYDAHPTGMLLTPEGNYLIHFYAGYVDSSWGDAWQSAFTEADFQAWLDETQRKSYFNAAAVPTTQDRLVTLSTCSYETNDSRFVVHGILEKAE